MDDEQFERELDRCHRAHHYRRSTWFDWLVVAFILACCAAGLWYFMTHNPVSP